MISKESQQPASEGTVSAPRFHAGPANIQDDVSIHIRYFTYATAAGLVSGADTSIVFTIDRPARAVWPYLKDFNLWQNDYGHYYSGVIGDLYDSAEHDLGRQTFALGSKDKMGAHRYQVIRVVPERTIVIFQPLPADDDNGGISGGFHVFMLNEQGNRTVVTIMMEHARRTRDETVEEALAHWGDPKVAPEWLRKWRDSFIPTLKKLVYEATKA